MSDTNDKLREECAAWWCEWIQDDDDLGPSMVELNPPELQALAAFARQQRAAALREAAERFRTNVRRDGLCSSWSPQSRGLIYRWLLNFAEELEKEYV